MLKHRLFEGIELPLEIYNGQAILDDFISFFSTDCDGNEVLFGFPDYESSYFRVFNERSGFIIKNIDLQVSSDNLIFNLSQQDATFEDNGRYYYEIGYVRAGGYDQVLRYGPLTVL